MEEVTNKILKEIEEKHNAGDFYAGLFFMLIDFIFYLIILYLFGFDCTKKCFSHRQKLSLLFLLDTIFRLCQLLFFASFIYSLTDEIVSTIFASFQFYVILILLNHILLNKKTQNLLENPEIKYPFLATILFFCFSFTSKISKFISLIQYTTAIIACLIYAYYVWGKLQIFLTNIERKHLISIKHIIHFLLLFIVLYFMIYYFLKVIILTIQYPLYLSYAEVASDIFKEVGKYLSYCLVISIYYLFNKYINEEKYDYSKNLDEGNIKIYSVGSI